MRRGDESGSPELPCGIEVAIVKCEKILVFVIEALDCVRLPLGKIPYIAHLQFVYATLTIFVNCGYKNGPVVNVAPLGLSIMSTSLLQSLGELTHHSMPMQLVQSPLV